MIKTVILVIILSAMIGGLIYFLALRTPTSKSLINTLPAIAPSAAPTPQPTPTYPPVTSDTNLKSAVDQLTPPDYSQDFTTLKQQINP